VTGGVRQCKRDERHDWRAPRCLRASHKALQRLVPTQREQDLLPLGNNSQRGLSHALPIRSKKNRYKELLRVGESLEDQKGMHFQVMTCAAIFVFQRELLLTEFRTAGGCGIAVP